MNDKERILMTILERMSMTQTLCLRGNQEKQFQDKDGQYVHFGCYDDRKVQAGDLVMAFTGPVSDWKIAWVDQVISDNECVLREIGSHRLCRWSNEQFKRIVGLDSSLLLEGDQYQFQIKVMRVFRKEDQYWYRFGGIDFLPNQIARIWIREAFGGIRNPSKPFSFEMPWNKRISLKKITEAMYANGYGTRKFELIDQPVEEK